MDRYGAEVPEGVEFLTLGADVQSGEVNPRIEAAIYGWGRGLECWLIGHFVLPGADSDEVGRVFRPSLHSLEICELMEPA